MMFRTSFAVFPWNPRPLPPLAPTLAMGEGAWLGLSSWRGYLKVPQ